MKLLNEKNRTQSNSNIRLIQRFQVAPHNEIFNNVSFFFHFQLHSILIISCINGKNNKYSEAEEQQTQNCVQYRYMYRWCVY